MRSIALNINKTSLRAVFGSSRIILDEILSVPGDFLVFSFLRAADIFESRNFIGDITNSLIRGTTTSESVKFGVNTFSR